MQEKIPQTDTVTNQETKKELYERIDNAEDTVRFMIQKAEQEGIDVSDIKEQTGQKNDEENEEYLFRLNEMVRTLYNKGVRVTYEEADEYRKQFFRPKQ